MTRMHPSLEATNHVCVVLLTGLGDVVHGLPVINALRDANPTLRITWVVEPMPAGILHGHRAIDRIVVYHRKDGFSGVRQLSRDLKGDVPIDLAINFNVYLKSIFPTLLSRAPRRLGFDRARSFDGIWIASNERLPGRPRAHTADMFLEFAEYLGVDVSSPRWDIEFSDEERREQRDFFDVFDGRPVATIVPASASHKKDWVPRRWAMVADALESDFGFRVAIAGGPGERERAIAHEIVKLSRAKIISAMGDSVRRLSWILDGSSLVVAPDTGPVHIARSLEVPVVGLYAHTNPYRVGPWRNFQNLWVDHYTDEGTQPDASNRLPKWDRMPTIRVNEVLERVSSAVELYDAGQPKALK